MSVTCTSRHQRVCSDADAAPLVGGPASDISYLVWIIARRRPAPRRIHPGYGLLGEDSSRRIAAIGRSLSTFNDKIRHASAIDRRWAYLSMTTIDPDDADASVGSRAAVLSRREAAISRRINP